VKKIPSPLILSLIAMALVSLTSCVSTPEKATATPAGAVPDHKPRYDYYEQGGGACCPYHAALRK
jgi:hypothetical protein